MTTEEKNKVISNIIKPIILAVGIGIIFTSLASLFLPVYESMGAEGYVSLTGITALKKIISQENGIQTVIIWFVSYFTAFSLPTLLGIISHILWTENKNR